MEGSNVMERERHPGRGFPSQGHVEGIQTVVDVHHCPSANGPRFERIGSEDHAAEVFGVPQSKQMFQKLCIRQI
jgi:hypothetical protein